jgi:multidrug transporter EmrE-like cation transporter
MKYALLLASVLFGAAGQILMKWGIASPRPLFQVQAPWLRMFVSWPVLAGLFAYGISSVFWLLTLRRLDLSLAYPMVSLGYVVVLIAGCFLFQETISVSRWLGVALILLGVCFLARS